MSIRETASILSTVRQAGRLGAAWAITVVLGPLGALADIFWDGDNPAGNFSYANNWYYDSTPAWGYGSGSLHFAYRNNASQTTLYHDLGYWPQINDIVWDSTFSAGLTLNSSGGGIDFNQRIENNSYRRQTVNCPLSGGKNGAPQIELNPVNGDLEINQNIYNDNGKEYHVWGNDNRSLTLNAALSGGNATKLRLRRGDTTVFLSAAQNWGDSTHGVEVPAGQFVVGSGGSLKAGIPVLLGGGGTSAKLLLLPPAGGTTFSQPVTVNAGGSVVIGGLYNTNGTHTFSGDITLNGPVTLFSGFDPATINFTGGLAGNGDVTVNQSGFSGRVVISGDNPLGGHVGGTVVTAGTLVVNGRIGAPSSVLQVASGAALRGFGYVYQSVAVAAGGTLAPGDAALGTLSISNTLALAGEAHFRLSKSGAALASDRVGGTASVAAGGALVVTASGDALAAGDAFSLFDVVPAGAFGTTNLPALGPNLAWHTTDNFRTLTVRRSVRGTLIMMNPGP
jgi:hypothetical protein